MAINTSAGKPRRREKPVQSLSEHIVRTRGHEPDEARSVGVTSEDGLHTASVFFLAGAASDERAARMDAFWKKMIEFQDRDTVVVALAVGEGR